MFATFTAILAATATVVDAASVPIFRRSGSISATPHDKYSSSVGVLGCKINTDRVAYWPSSVSCDDICVKVSYGGRSVNLLKIDTSGGAFDMSYDAWNYLGFGKSATQDPHSGGGIAMDYQVVDPSECAHLLDNGKLPLSAANSMNYLSSCLAQPNSWVAKNYKLININDPCCRNGIDEVCSLNLDVSNQPSCPGTLGAVDSLDMPVININYGTGEKEVAL